MAAINLETTDADLARILECVESSIDQKMATVAKSTDMYQRASVHTHCDHLRRIAADIRTNLEVKMNEIKTPASVLLDHLHTKLTSRQNDAHLSHRLRVQAPVISKLRHGTLEIGPSLILRVHEEFGLPVEQIRQLAGMPAYVRGA